MLDEDWCDLVSRGTTDFTLFNRKELLPEALFVFQVIKK